jgi:hypothetical protein
MFDVRTAFERKLPSYELQLRWDNMSHFKIPISEKPTDVKKHAEEIQPLEQEINSHFHDIVAHRLVAKR